MIRPEVMTAILRDHRLDAMGIHGLRHWGRVLETGLRLASSTGADARVVALFAVLHDARRENDGHDPGHGARGAALARTLQPWLGLSEPQLQLLEYACRHHTDGLVEGDITALTCWDADRLDLWRVHIAPMRSRLCTEAARAADVLEWARVRSERDHAEAVVRDWERLAAR